MKQELVKPVVKVGNSAGVILPKEWLNATAKIKLVKKPLNIKKDILEILEPFMKSITGIYIVGSYARGEETSKSDIDVLVITNKTNKKIIKGKYNANLISQKNIEDSLRNNIMPILPMLREAKALLNEELIKNYKKMPLTRKNLRPIIEITKSSLNVNKEFIKLARETGENLEDASAYSLILNMRTLYLLECLRKSKIGSTNELRILIKKISGSLKAYDGYLRSKNNGRDGGSLPLKEAEKLYEYLKKELERLEKWLKKKDIREGNRKYRKTD